MHTQIASSLFTWFAGFVVMLNFQMVWSRTNMPVHVWNWWHNEKIYTSDDLVTASLRYGAFGDLWVCPICLGQYLAILLVGGLWLIDHSFSFFGAFLGFLSWTGVAGKVVDVHGPASAQRLPESTPISLPEPVSPAVAGSGVAVVEQLLRDQAGKVGDIKPDPLWTKLLSSLHQPPADNAEAVKIARAFAEEKMKLTAGGTKKCPACTSGAMIRKYMALMYDAGIRA